MNQILDNFKMTFKLWMEDKIITQSAALSYYTVFSIGPLLLIALAIGGLFFGAEATHGEIFTSLQGLLGKQGAGAIEGLVKSADLKDTGIFAAGVGVVTLLIGATSAFAQLQEALNLIWKVQPKKNSGIWSIVRQRLMSFSLILVIAFLLMVSLIFNAVIAGVGKFASDHLIGGAVLWEVINFGISFGLTTLLFAALYKILPDIIILWRDVWVGAAFTALLFTVGKLLIGLYLGKSAVTSSYGAAGSILVVLLWTYYSSAILLFGAEYCRVHAVKKSGKIELKNGAEWMPGQNGSIIPAPKTKA